MKASVVIPTWNRPEAMICALQALAAQTVPVDDFEVIVVDDGSTEEHSARVAQYVDAQTDIDLTYLRQPVNGGKAKTVNAGLSRAKYPLAILTDDDCVPVADWIRSHVAMHQAHPGNAISAFGPILLPDEWIATSNLSRYIHSRYAGNRLNPPADGTPLVAPPKFFGGGNVSVPLERLFAVGLFDESISRSQDVELGFRLWKAGVPLLFSPTATVTHYAQAARDLDRWIAVLTKTYTHTIPQLKVRCPDAMNCFGHWFLEKPTPGQESLRRTLYKYLIRATVRRAVAARVAQWVKRTDAEPRCYWPPAFQYVLASACLEAVKSRDRALQAPHAAAGESMHVR